MIYYVYDGSFEGLLTSIYKSYYRKEIPNKIISSSDYQDNLLVNFVHIDTDEKKAEKVYNSIKEKISNRALENVFYTYLSELKESGTWIYQYLRLGWKVGRKIDSMLTEDIVLNVHKTRRKVGREVHFILGLLRFKELENNIFYAPFEPQYNIVALVAPHFANRLSEQSWVIHDVKRDIGVLYNGNEWIVKDITLKEKPKLSENEIFYQNLWKKYFDSIAIKNRINLKLQKSNMPMKYWKYLVEKN